MSELDALGRELRAELGSPPKSWVAEQRQRLRRVELGKPRPPRPRALAVAFVTALAASVWVGVALYLGARGTEGAGDADVWLAAEDLRGPYQMAEGSTIVLQPGARGRLSREQASSRFDLHQGVGLFEVEKRPGQDFVVVAGQYEVRVVGTKFSVEYSPPKGLEVDVSRGIVSVHLPTRSAPVELQAGDRLRASDKDFVLQHAKPAAVEADAVASAQPSVEAEHEHEHAAPEGAAAAKLRAQAEEDWHTLYTKGDYAAAFRAAQSLGFAKLLRELDVNRLSDLANAGRLSGNTGPALEALQAVERRFAGTPQATDAGFLIGRIHAGSGATSKAILRFESYLEAGESARYSVEAIGRLIELYAAQGRKEPAEAMARRYLKRAPKGPYQRLAHSVLHAK